MLPRGRWFDLFQLLRQHGGANGLADAIAIAGSNLYSQHEPVAQSDRVAERQDLGADECTGVDGIPHSNAVGVAVSDTHKLSECQPDCIAVGVADHRRGLSPTREMCLRRLQYCGAVLSKCGWKLLCVLHEHGLANSGAVYLAIGVAELQPDDEPDSESDGKSHSDN